MLAHTQSQISILVGLDEYSKMTNKDAGRVTSSDVPHHQHPDPQNTDMIEEDRDSLLRK